MTEQRRITDELRHNIEGAEQLYGCECRLLTEIADRIDAEHEAKVAYWQEASYKDGYDEGFASADDWCAQHEDAMAEHGWIRMPKDADGEAWHIGDRTESGQTIEAMGLNKHGWHFVGTVNEIDPAIHRHYHAPTVEDILCELLDKVDDDRAGQAEIIAEYAKRLRLAGDAE